MRRDRLAGPTPPAAVANDPIALLERELVSAAQRRAATGPVPEVIPWPRARRRRIRVGDALSAAAAAGAVIVALAVLALLVLRW